MRIDGFMNWMGPVLMGATGLLGWLLVVAAAVAAVCWVRIPGDGARSLGDGRGGLLARHLLDERFARGEIDADEYDDRRRILERRPA